MVISRMFTRRWASIDDMPMHNWIEVTEGKLEFVRKNPTKGGDPYSKDDDAWLRLYDQYINVFGHHERFLKIKKHEYNIAKLQTQWMVDPVKYGFNKTMINIERENIKEIQKGMMSGMSVREANIHVSKFMDARGVLNLKQISVLDYFTILKEYGKANTKG